MFHPEINPSKYSTHIAKSIVTFSQNAFVSEEVLLGIYIASSLLTLRVQYRTDGECYASS